MPKITLTLTVENDGQFKLHGPIQDRMLCYGMLEMARELLAGRAIRRAVASDAAGDIIIPKLNLSLPNDS